MTSVLVELEEAEGQMLAEPVRYPSGSKILGRGRLLAEKDLVTLAFHGVKGVLVFKTGQGEITEPEVLEALLPYAVSGAFETRRGSQGQIEFFAQANCCIFVDEAKMALLNRCGVAVLCSKPQFSHVPQGQRFASLRARPFSAPSSAVQSVKMLMGNAHCIEIKRCLPLKTAVLFSDPTDPVRARTLYESICRQRLERFGVSPVFFECLEQEVEIRECIGSAIAQGFELILIASTVSPTVPEDALGRALRGMGARMEHFLAPVDPGSLLLLAFAGQVPILSAPGCFRSLKPNVLDLVVPPLLTKYPLRSAQLSSLGMGGLLG